MKDEKVKFRISFLLFPKQKLLYNTAETDFHKELKPEALKSLYRSPGYKPIDPMQKLCPAVVVILEFRST